MSTPLRIKKAMSRDEVALLVDLVVKRPAITIKETNAANNKLKEDAWTSLAIEFNEISDQARSKEQIKLKWDNLKKAARKRVSQCEKDEAEMVPLGDILDRVSDLLGYSKPDGPYSSDWIVVDSVGESYTKSAKKRKSENPVEESLIDKYKKKFESNTGKKESSGAKERNQAIAKYYEKKAEKTELEIKLLKIQLNKQCDCNNSCKINSIYDNRDKSEIINKINKLSSIINSEKHNMEYCSNKNTNGGSKLNNSDRTNNKFNSSEDSNSNSNDLSESKDNIVYINIVKEETTSP